MVKYHKIQSGDKMNIQNKIKVRTLLLSIIVLFVYWIVGYIYLTDEFKNSLDRQFQSLKESAYTMFDFELNQEKEHLSDKLDEFLALSDIKKSIQDKDIKSINFIISKNYSKIIMMDRFIYDIVIYSKNNKSIYHISKDKDIVSKNENIKNTLTGGFKLSGSIMLYGLKRPVYLDKKIIGFVEILVEAKKIIRNLNLLLNIKTAIILDKNISSSDIKLLESSDMLKYYFEAKKSDEFKFFKVDMNKRLLGYDKKTVGYLVIGYDMSKAVEKSQDFIYKMFWIGIVIIVCIIFIIYTGFKSLLKHTTKESYTDKLTGLNNRDSLHHDLSKNESNILILTNIKEFSLLNQYYGLEVANEVLKQVGIGFKEFGKKHNMGVYRISADEYVLLSNDNRLGVVECGDILDELNDKISSMEIRVGENDETLRVEVYSGVSFNGKLLLEEAQVALREAKIKGLSYLAYAQNLDNKVDTKVILDVKKIIKHAIENKNIIPFFQPITDRYGEFIKYEALVRILDFEDGNEKILYPDQFLPIAIRSGLYVELAKEMLFRSLTFFKDRDEKISVNFLPNDFYNHDIMERFIGLVQMYKHPERIVVEITEQEGIGDFDRLFKIVKKLRKLGVMIAVDDFGSGYANYVHILQLKPDYLKIDGSLIKNILHDEDSQILVKSITDFARYMKIKTIAEFVENEDIFELLKTYGVDEFQGYYFGKPLNLISGPNIY